MKQEIIEHVTPVDALVAVAKRLSFQEHRHGMASEDFYDKYEKRRVFGNCCCLAGRVSEVRVISVHLSPPTLFSWGRRPVRPLKNK